jgi:hypothetical protein
MASDDVTPDEIKCPNCGELIPVSQAIYHQIANRTREELKAETLEQRKAIVAKERALQEQEGSIEQTISERVQLAKAEVQREADERARAALSVELEDLRRQASEKDAKLLEAERAELELRQHKRQLEDRERSLELEMARKIDAERRNIEDSTTRRLQEEHHLKDEEKDKKLRDALRMNDELRRKLEQGSQQTQGEVLELELEALIRSEFPSDQIEPVPKGVSGADVIQRVVDKHGNICGTILWESKRTKAWSDGWLQKLKDDQRALKADVAVIVSEALPKDCNSFSQVSGVWVSNPQCAIGLAIAIRLQLTEVAIVRLAAVGKNEKMEVIYDYLSGSEFKQRVEAIVEAFVSMQQDLLEERRITERRWAKREKQIQRVISNTSGMYGDLQGLIGSSLQDIPALSATPGDATQGATAQHSLALPFPSTEVDETDSGENGL